MLKPHQPSWAAREGHGSVQIGSWKWNLLPGMRAEEADDGAMIWVFDPASGDLHALVQGGEVDVPRPLRAQVVKKYFSD